MYQDVSPAVERAAEAARRWAAELGAPAVRLSDWLLGLLDEEEGRPAELLARLGTDVPAVRTALPEPGRFGDVPAPPDADLFASARHQGLRLRGDPGLTTDLVLVAVVAASEAFAGELAGLGIELPALEAALHRPDVVSSGPATRASFVLPTEPARMDAARIVDANLNRARESLRVIDDYARFCLNDPVLTERLKSLRHKVGEIGKLLPVGALLAARDTPGDVGTTVSAGSEFERASPAHVAAVNFKRLQESLRSVEEYGKVLNPEFAGEIERVRYEVYSLESVVVRGSAARDRLSAATVYVLLTGSQCTAAMDWTIEQAAAGGASVFQLREKSLTDSELLKTARSVREWTALVGALFIVNDRPDIAQLSGADGVHLGQDDLPVSAARRIVGPDALIGVSTHSIEQVRKAVLDGADYIGVGPAFPSKTKNFTDFPGLPFITAASAETSIPAFVLGGIDPETVKLAARAGARRVAVGAAVLSADDPGSVATRLRDTLDSNRRKQLEE